MDQHGWVILVGCCGWPERRDAYVAVFPVVELQHTFYQLPSERLAERWRSSVPPGFEFAIRAWQAITDRAASPTYRRLREPLAGNPERYGAFQPSPEVDVAWERTLAVARVLGASTVVCQCPASFTPSDEHVENLRRFFAAASRDGLRLVWEPRGGAWDATLVGELCAELDLVHGVDPFVTALVHGDIAYFRLHGIGGYRYRFTDDDLHRLVGWCRDALGANWKAVYVLFNNIAMLADARRFLALTAQSSW